MITEGKRLLEPSVNSIRRWPFVTGMDIRDRDSKEALSNTEPLTNVTVHREIAELGKYISFDDQAETLLPKMDQKRSPSGQSSSNVATPRKRQSGVDDLRLSIRRQPPLHVFSNESFEIEYDLDVNPRSQNSPPSNIEIALSLESIKGIKEGDVSLICLEEPRLSNTRKTGKVRCRLPCPKLSKQTGAAVCIRVSAKGNENISSCLTDYINIVNIKLRLISIGERWESEWYKDEGGKEKSMEIHVQAFNHHNKPVEQNFPLSLTLHYNAPSTPMVSKQDILRVTAPDDCLKIDRMLGWKSKIKFRIEDVSKNHQNQNFLAQVSAKGKGYRDVAPCYTMPVRVRSKRNKKRPVRSTKGASNQTHERSSTKTTINPTLLGSSRQAYSRNSSSADRLERSNESDLRDAVEKVVAWSDDVINSLYPLQWQVIGYAQGPDGRADFTRPYHSMPNPNLVIGRVLASSDATRRNLRILQDFVDKTKQSEGARASVQDKEFCPSLDVQPFAVNSSLNDEAMKRPGRDPEYQEQYHQPMPFFQPHNLHQTFQTESTQTIDGPTTAHPTNEAGSEAAVEFVLAKQYKSANSGEHLGFPAFSLSRELLGFYRESDETVGSQFVPICNHLGFGQVESMQATRILEQALADRSEAVHRLKDWGSIGNLIDRCLVYDFSADLSNTSSS